MFHSKENGFSLVELIVVLIITAILAQLGFTAFNRYARRTRAFAAKTALKNIQRECETNRNLQVSETFTLLPIKGYSHSPISSSSCFGNKNSGFVSLNPENREDPTFTYNHSKGIINKIDPLSNNIKKTFLKEKYPNSVKWVSCADNRAHRYTGANVGVTSRWSRNYPFDKDPKTVWACSQNGDIKFDLGKTQKIDSINIFNPGFRFKYTNDISDAANYIKLYVDDKLVAEGIQQAGVKDQWDIDDIEGRYITYKTFIKPHNKECLIINGSCPQGSQRNTNRYSELGEISINGEKQSKFLGDPKYDYKYIFKKECRVKWFRSSFSYWDYANNSPTCALLEN